MWEIEEGDYVGLSCTSFCALLKYQNEPGFVSLVNMNINMNRVYTVGMMADFGRMPSIKSRIALQAIIGETTPCV